MFIYHCGECYEYKGAPLVCPKCGKVLRLPKKTRETLGEWKREKEEENLLECPPPTSLKE